MCFVPQPFNALWRHGDLRTSGTRAHYVKGIWTIKVGKKQIRYLLPIRGMVPTEKRIRRPCDYLSSDQAFLK